MAPPQKGKVGTKGSKQIIEENRATLNFYRNMAMIANLVSMSVMVIFYRTTMNVFLQVFATMVYVGAYQFMAYMSKAKYSETGQIIDSGSDLNMEGGIAEHVKDIIILTAGCQVLSSAISNYFWLLWLLAPARLFWILWKNILQPYFIQSGPEGQPEINEKKQKKLERRQKKFANGR